MIVPLFRFKFRMTIVLLLLMMLLAACVYNAGRDTIDRTTVANLNLQKFMGRWYEIARFDHSFERGLDNVIAEYQLRDDGKVSVTNSGWKGEKYKWAEGKAKQPDPTGDPAHLRVSFFLFF